MRIICLFTFLLARSDSQHWGAHLIPYSARPSRNTLTIPREFDIHKAVRQVKTSRHHLSDKSSCSSASLRNHLSVEPITGYFFIRLMSNKLIALHHVITLSFHTERTNLCWQIWKITKNAPFQAFLFLHFVRRRSFLFEAAKWRIHWHEFVWHEGDFIFPLPEPDRVS